MTPDPTGTKNTNQVSSNLTKRLAELLNEHLLGLIAEHTKDLIPKQEAAEQVATVWNKFRELIENLKESVNGAESPGSIANYHFAKFILYEMKLLNCDPAKILAQRDERVGKIAFKAGQDSELEAWKMHIGFHHGNTKPYGLCSFCKGEQKEDERITNELAVVYSCPHMLRYPECSVCSPESVRQVALEEVEKAVEAQREKVEVDEEDVHRNLAVSQCVRAVHSLIEKGKEGK